MFWIFLIQRRGSGNREQKWQPKTKPKSVTSASASVDEAVTSKLGGLSISDGQVWKPKSYGTVTGSNAADAAAAAADVQTEKINVDLSRIFLKPNLLENFKVDNSTYSLAQIRATFYPKFENEKSDQEVDCLFKIFPSFWITEQFDFLFLFITFDFWYIMCLD